MSFNNEVLKLMNLKLQLNNVNLQFETFLSNLNNGLIPNLGVSLEEISLKLINLGIEMLNIEMQSKDISYFNSAQQIKNIGDMMQNISLQMTNMNSMKMNNINMGIPAPNMMNNNFNDFTPKVNIRISTVDGKNTDLSLKFGTTIKEMIDLFYIRNQMTKNDNHLDFIYNAQKIKRDDMTPIEKFFIGTQPKIIAINNNQIIG